MRKHMLPIFCHIGSSDTDLGLQNRCLRCTGRDFPLPSICDSVLVSFYYAYQFDGRRLRWNNRPPSATSGKSFRNSCRRGRYFSRGYFRRLSYRCTGDPRSMEIQPAFCHRSPADAGILQQCRACLSFWDAGPLLFLSKISLAFVGYPYPICNNCGNTSSGAQQ